MLTVGELSAAHFGVLFHLTVPVGPDGATETYTGEVVRVQHNSPGPSLDYTGQLQPAETLIVLGSWGGTLPPNHPIARAADTTSGYPAGAGSAEPQHIETEG